MTITDAQVHIWQADTPERPHIKVDASKPHRETPLTYERLLAEMNRAGVDRAILVPPSWDGYRNDYALTAAQKYPDRFAVMGKVPLNVPASKDKLPTWLKQSGMKGFRISFRHSGTHSLLDDGSADWFWADCERYDIPVMIFAPFAVAAIGKIARRHPGLRVIVDHMGLNVQWRGKDLTPGVDVLLTFAGLANVAVKASCLPCYVAENYPFRTLHPQLRKVVEAFGAQRIMWGTDLSQSPISYRQNVTLFTEELDFLSPDDKEWIMGKSLAHWLRWTV